MAREKATPRKTVTSPVKRARRNAASARVGQSFGSGSPVYYQYTGTDTRYYETLGLLVAPNDQVDFSTVTPSTPPPDGFWVSSSGPATVTPGPAFTNPAPGLSYAPLFPAWASNMSYVAGQMVYAPSGNIARAASTHTSGSSYPTDLSAGKWTEYPSSSADSAAYQPGAPYAPLGLRGFSALKAAMNRGVSTGILVLGDSTSNTGGGTPGSTRWPVMLATWLAAQFPAYSVQSRRYNSTAGSYDAPVVTAGSPQGRYGVFDGTCGVQHWGNGQIEAGGDLELRIKLALPSTLPISGNPMLLSRDSGSSGGRGWQLAFIGSQMRFLFSTDGSSTFLSASTSVNVTYTANTPTWFRVTFQKSTGQVIFYTAADTGTASPPTSWTQIGTTQTVTAGSSIFDASAVQPVNVGQYGNAGQSLPSGTAVYEVEVRNSIGGTSIVPRYMDGWTPYQPGSTVTMNGPPVLTILNGGNPGSTLAVNDADPLFTLLADTSYHADLVLASDSHNESSTAAMAGNKWRTALSSWLTQVEARVPRASFVWMTQNPKDPTIATAAQAHTERNFEAIQWAERSQVTVLDVYRAFTDQVAAGTPLSSLLYNDGIHPQDGTAGDLTKGSPLWASVVQAAVANAVA